MFELPLNEIDGALTWDHLLLNRQQMQLIGTITKYTLLCSMSIAAKCVSLTYFGIFMLFNFNLDGHLWHSLYHVANQWIFVCSMFIEIFCVWLTFIYNQAIYEKCCRYPHGICNSWCLTLAGKRANAMIKEIVPETNVVPTMKMVPSMAVVQSTSNPGPPIEAQSEDESDSFE